MEKYREGFDKKIRPHMNQEGKVLVEPFKDAQFALQKAIFASREREEFFQGAYVDILTDLFTAWLKTEPHAQKEREYLYTCAMALGSVKKKLIDIETYGKNQKFLNPEIEQVGNENE